MKTYIVVLPYSETSRLFHASITKQEESFIGENSSVVYYQSQAKKFTSLESAGEEIKNIENKGVFVRELA